VVAVSPPSVCSCRGDGATDVKEPGTEEPYVDELCSQ
jgi:hypothetical protein